MTAGALRRRLLYVAWGVGLVFLLVGCGTDGDAGQSSATPAIDWRQPVIDWIVAQESSPEAPLDGALAALAE